MKAILHMTQNCNLRCKYCYARAKTGDRMTMDIARKGIDLAIKHGENSACVSYFGGEPLLMFKEIKELTTYAHAQGRRAGKKMHYRLSSNGTLFTEEILAFCRDHNMLFAVSIDGDREAHDSQRVMADGNGSFDLLNSKLDMILKYNPKTVVTSVITPATAGRLAESFEFLWGRGIRFFANQPDYSHPDWDQESFAALTESYHKMAKLYIEKARLGEHFFLALFDEKL